MKTVVIYHSADFDGLFCRKIAKRFLPGATFIGWNYGEPTPEIGECDSLYILDLSIEELMGHPKLIWIDHHKTAIDKYPTSIPGYRIEGVAACRLAWQWFRCLFLSQNEALELPLPGKEDYVARGVWEPLAVRLAGEYDIWDKRDERAELFQHGLQSRELTEEIWRQLLDGYELLVDELVEGGKAIQYYQAERDKSAIKHCGYDLQWEGLNFLACNAGAPRFNSFLFTAGLRPDHDACLGYRFDGRKHQVSLYHAPGKEGHDLSKIAVKYGGGGHRGACGFSVEKLPFE